MKNTRIFTALKIFSNILQKSVDKVSNHLLKLMPKFGASMPGKRESSKKQVAFWFTPQERAMLEKVARMRGLNMTEVVKQAITKIIAILIRFPICSRRQL